jgi:hypothetical protein
MSLVTQDRLKRAVCSAARLRLSCVIKDMIVTHKLGACVQLSLQGLLMHPA